MTYFFASTEEASNVFDGVENRGSMEMMSGDSKCKNSTKTVKE